VDTVQRAATRLAESRIRGIEMRLRSRTEQTVKVPALDLAVDFAADEELHTEISAKFRKEGVRTELAAVGLELAHWWTDGEGRFALSLSVVR
jgi:L-histidine N-alpha-methyltransferase